MLPSAQMVQALYADLMQGNLSKMLALIDEHTTIYAPESLPYGGRYKGRDGYIALMTAANKTWESLRIIPGMVVASGEVVVVTGECIGKAAAATGVIHLPYVHLWRMPGGLITEIWMYFWDTAALLAYLKGTPL